MSDGGVNIVNRALMDCRVPILAYHSIANEGTAALAPYRVAPARFFAQMQFLRERGYHAMSLADWAFCVATRRHVPGRPIVITFDDGYADFMTEAWPTLRQLNFRATVFVVTGRVGGVADWDRAAAEPRPLLDWHDLDALQQAGNLIGSHCNVHRDLTRLSDAEIAADAAAARDAFRRELASEATYVAFPWGRSDRRVRLALGRAGYTCGVGIAGGLSTLSDEPLNLPRIEVFGDDTLDMFAAKIEADRPPPKERAVHAVSLRIDRLMAELESIKQGLPDLREPQRSFAVRLAQLFETAGAEVERELAPFEEIAPGIRVGFEGTASARGGTAPQPEPQFGPAGCAALRLSFTPPSRWFSLDAIGGWPELDGCTRFQVGLTIKADRDVDVRTVLRIWLKSGQYREIRLADWRICAAEQHYTVGRTLQLPEPLDIDYDCDPLFVILFDTQAELNVELFYAILYFS